MQIKKVIQENRKETLRITTNYGVRKIQIFDSVARGEAGLNSDLDILVELDPGYTLLDLIAIKQDLEDLLGCSVDVVTEAALSP